MTTRAPARRFRFFGGKGGVGKTTCAAAAALTSAELGRRVLAVSTDPAHSLADALACRLGARPRRVATRRGRLDAVLLDADRALARWLRARQAAFRTIASRGTYLDDEDIDQLLGLSLPGVDELAGLIELERLARSGEYDEIVVDTAPTGHTLRLLEMPETLVRIADVLDDMEAKHRFLAQSLGGAFCADAADDVIGEIAAQGEALAALVRDPARARFAWILLPEPMALEEAQDGVRALEEMGISVSEIVINQITPPPRGACPHCADRVRSERAVIGRARAAFPGRTVRLLAAAATEPRGPVLLRSIGRALSATGRGAALERNRAPARRRLRPTAGRADWLAEAIPDSVKLVIVAGKGGVGKTTAATATALLLAARAPRKQVLLLSADPAHSLGDVLDAAVSDQELAVAGAPAGLRVRELDATRAFAERRERYRNAVDQLFDAIAGGSRFDASYDRQVVQDLIELAPPGLDELFAVLTLVEALVENQRFDVVVLDTAPTGHALRLLELPAGALAWVRVLLAILLKYRRLTGLGEVAEELVALSRQLRALEALLRDGARTRCLVVTRAAELPRRETVRLLAALGRLGLPLPFVLCNATTGPGCRRCAQKARAEARELQILRRRMRSAILVAPSLAPPPRGARALMRFGETWSRHEP